MTSITVTRKSYKQISFFGIFLTNSTRQTHNMITFGSFFLHPHQKLMEKLNFRWRKIFFLRVWKWRSSQCQESAADFWISKEGNSVWIINHNDNIQPSSSIVVRTRVPHWFLSESPHKKLFQREEKITPHLTQKSVLPFCNCTMTNFL